MIDSNDVHNRMHRIENTPINNARWTEELFKTKHGAKWLSESFGQTNDPFLQLETLEETLVERHGKKVGLTKKNKGPLSKEGADINKPMYSDMVKRSMGTERGSAKEEISEPKVGTFEKYTKGVGRKIMEKQGWSEGRGLGNGRKEGQKECLPKALGFFSEK